MDQPSELIELLLVGALMCLAIVAGLSLVNFNLI